MDAAKEVRKFIDTQNKLKTLRFITCGSVDDGKSTLLGRLLYESQLIFDDQIESLKIESKKIGTQGDKIDFALLVDGLAAEREQGITIDVAYRFFSTNKRKYIVADSPGHEQYTRNMITAASTADLAIILIDARKGVLEQTKRHSYLANIVGIKNLIVAVNKMDLIEYSQNKFNEIVNDFEKQIYSKLNFSKITYIPISALEGDNITSKSENMMWYTSEPILHLLDHHDAIENESTINFSMPVQMVLRPNQNFRGYSGTVTSGSIEVGKKIFVSQSGETANVKEIYLGDKIIQKCAINQPVTITLDKEIDVSRGDVITSNKFLDSGRIFNVKLVWLENAVGNKNRYFMLKIGTKSINARIINIKHLIDINTFENKPPTNLNINNIAECEILTDEPIVFSKYADLKALGSFILINKETNSTCAAGVINFQTRRSEHISKEKTSINLEKRNQLLGNKTKVIWFTGLSGSGKSTIANLLEVELHGKGILTYLLDGDNLRHGLNQDLGFSEQDRIENVRRTGEVARLLYDSGVVTIAAFISPFKRDREAARKLLRDGEFVEVYIKTPLKVAEARDPKGLYKKARAGIIPNFTGINSPYEEPEKPEIIIDTEKHSAKEAVNKIIEFLEGKL